MADTLQDVADNLTVLIRAELEVQHRLTGHPTPAPGCPVCDAHPPRAYRPVTFDRARPTP